MRIVLVALCLLLAMAAGAAAQDPVEVDPSHYEVVLENDAVRVLRITYPAGERSVMHRHPDAVAVFLTDGKIQFTLPDGSTAMAEAQAGSSIWTAATHHLPQNLGEGTFIGILVELKGGGN